MFSLPEYSDMWGRSTHESTFPYIPCEDIKWAIHVQYNVCSRQ